MLSSGMWTGVQLLVSPRVGVQQLGAGIGNLFGKHLAGMAAQAFTVQVPHKSLDAALGQTAAQYCFRPISCCTHSLPPRPSLTSMWPLSLFA